jgi:hypothetical protein
MRNQPQSYGEKCAFLVPNLTKSQEVEQAKKNTQELIDISFDLRHKTRDVDVKQWYTQAITNFETGLQLLEKGVIGNYYENEQQGGFSTKSRQEGFQQQRQQSQMQDSL